ncbi:MAG: hypothetical protein JNK91_01225 [Ferruginibacter sp.]|nr:hypothetical protein [Ferruginibacter sp.]
MCELHEHVHISTGYWICGCYGPRDISSWSTCVDCANPAWAFWATATGPLFGTPNLILIHVAVMILLLFVFRKSLVLAFSNGIPPRTNV